MKDIFWIGEINPLTLSFCVLRLVFYVDVFIMGQKVQKKLNKNFKFSS